MSVILDVLRKLEREKSSRRSTAANIALDILKPDPPRSEKRNPLLFTAIGATALATAAITYALVGFGLLTTPPSPEPANPPATSRTIAAAPPDTGVPSESPLPPAKPLPAASQKTTPAPLPPVSNRETRVDKSRVSTDAPTATEEKTAAISRDEKEADKNATPEKANIPPQKSEGLIKDTPAPPQQAADKSAPTPPSLKISAIIWYADPSRRFAMINDTITYEGSVIEEAKVEEIYPSRVRFSHNGRPFEISVK